MLNCKYDLVYKRYLTFDGLMLDNENIMWSSICTHFHFVAAELYTGYLSVQKKWYLHACAKIKIQP